MYVDFPSLAVYARVNSASLVWSHLGKEFKPMLCYRLCEIDDRCGPLQLVELIVF